MSELASSGAAVRVTPDNFIRAETDRYFGAVVQDHGFGRFEHNRTPVPIDHQTVIRSNRDTLYSGAVFDLDAGPVTITLPDPGRRFLSMQVIDEDQYTAQVAYRPGRYRLSRAQIGTRYVLVAIRILVDPFDPADLKAVHALQDATQIEAQGAGVFETPSWDPQSQAQVRAALVNLAESLPDSRHMFGPRDGDLDPVRRLIGAAAAWGGNPETEAIYVNITPAQNDGVTPYRLTVKDVPVDGFWSISVYNADGYFQANPRNAYSLNSVTAAKAPNGAVTVRFGEGEGRNDLPIMPGWNGLVRLYRPRPEILDGRWTFPEIRPVAS